MNGLLRLLPGAAQVSLLYNALGLNQEEKVALDGFYGRLKQVPVLRSLPSEFLPDSLDKALTALIGVSKATGLNVRIPPAAQRVLDHPVIRQALSSELARLVEQDEASPQLLAVIGKALRAFKPDFDHTQYPTLASVIDGVVFQPLLYRGESGVVSTCRECGFTQQIDSIPSHGMIQCRECGFTQQVKV